MSKSYFTVKALSNTGIKEILKSPAHFKTFEESQKMETPAQRVGSALHSLLLDPEPRVSVFSETKTLTSKKALKFIEEHPDRIILTPREAAEVEAAAAAVRKIPQLNMLLSQCQKELQCHGMMQTSEGRSVPVKAMFDAISSKVILDFKTTKELLSKFPLEAKKYRYDIQSAWYQEMALQMDGILRQVYFVAIEKFAPQGVRLFKFSQEKIDRAREDCFRAVDIYGKCLAEDHWPSYDSTEIIELDWK